jgi:K(+)-stimulated pyrophosphate-energized sodium pump
LPTAQGSLPHIAGLIRKGAFTFLSREYRILSIFAGIISVLILLFSQNHFGSGISYPITAW